MSSKIEQVNFGVGIKLNGEQKGKQITGIYPSHSHPTLESIVEAVVNYLNEKLGTKLAVVPVLYEDELIHRCAIHGCVMQIVRPGSYQCHECELERVKESVQE